MHTKILRVKFHLEETWMSPFKKSFNQWWVWIFEYSNKMSLEYYSYSYPCYFRNTNIFEYSFGKYVASKYIWIFVRYIMWYLNIFGYSFVSILWYSLITGICSYYWSILLESNNCWTVYGGVRRGRVFHQLATFLVSL